MKELSDGCGLTALDPNDRQATALAQRAGHARVAWNHALAGFKAGLDAGEFRNDRKPRPRFNAAKSGSVEFGVEPERCEERDHQAARPIKGRRKGAPGARTSFRCSKRKDFTTRSKRTTSAGR